MEYTKELLEQEKIKTVEGEVLYFEHTPLEQIIDNMWKDIRKDIRMLTIEVEKS